MKTTRKILIALLVMMTLLVGTFAIVSSASDAPEARANDTITVYFRNDWLWPEVYCHYWGGSSSTPWPGDKMVKIGEQNDDNGDPRDVYYAEIPADSKGVIFNGLENGNADNRQQTNNIESGIVDGAAWTIYYDGGSKYKVISFTPDHSLEWVETGRQAASCTVNGYIDYVCKCGCGVSKRDTIPAAHSFSGNVCSVCGFDASKSSVLYLKNTAAWEKVQAYSWDENETVNKSWPGVAMTLVEGTTDVYRIELNAGMKFVIFNNKVGDVGVQTDDLVIPANGCIIFDNTTNTWAEYHTPEVVPAVPSTCTTPGKTEGSKCAGCGKVLVPQEDVPVGNHVYINGFCAYYATCNTVQTLVVGDNLLPLNEYAINNAAMVLVYVPAAGWYGVFGDGLTCWLFTDVVGGPNTDFSIGDDGSYTGASWNNVSVTGEAYLEAGLYWISAIANSQVTAYTGFGVKVCAHTGTPVCGEKTVCTLCEKPFGNVTEHTGGTATCTAQAVCTICEQPYGDLLSHTGGTATCTAQAVCDSCGQSYGVILNHNYVNGVCSGCGATENDQPEHVNTLVVGENNKIVITGKNDNGAGFFIEYVTFVSEEKATYKFAGEGTTIYIFEGNTLISMTGEAVLDVGTYDICIAAGVGVTPGPAGTYNVSVTKTEYVEPPHKNALAVGDNKFIVTDNELAAYAEYILFTASEDGCYTFTAPENSGIKFFVFLTATPDITKDFSVNNKGSDTLSVSAHLEAGTYMVVVNYYYGSTVAGEYNITVAKTGEYDPNGNVIEVPSKNTLVLGDFKYTLNQALKNNLAEFTTFTAVKSGYYTFNIGKLLTGYLWYANPDITYDELAALGTSAPYVWNLDLNVEKTDSFTVYLEAGKTYWVGFNFDSAPVGEYDMSITYSETDPQAPTDGPQPEQKPDDKPAEEPELNLFQKILKAITDFFANIVNWFKNLIPVKK